MKTDINCFELKEIYNNYSIQGLKGLFKTKTILKYYIYIYARLYWGKKLGQNVIWFHLVKKKLWCISRDVNENLKYKYV